MKIFYQIEPLFDEDNYELWSIRMKTLLSKKRIRDYVTIKNYNSQLLVENDSTTRNMFKDVERAASLILLNLYEGSLLQIQHIVNSYDIWIALKNLYNSKEFSSKFLLCRQLFEISLVNCDDNMKQYLNQIKRLNDQLITKKILIFEKVIYVWVLNNFFENYESLITTIT